MPRPRRRIRCASRSPRSSASTSAASGSSRPMSAAGSGRRRGSTRKRSSWRRLALELDHPVRWIEDRNEHLLTARAYPRPPLQGHRLCRPARPILGVDAEIVVDAGAYGLWPQGPYQEANMAARTLPGPYTIPNYRARTFTVATNKTPLGPYRGVGRPGRLLCDRADDRRGRARGRARPGRGAHREHDRAGADAVHVGRRHALRHRRLSRRACGCAPSCWTAGRSARGSSAASPTAG